SVPAWVSDPSRCALSISRSPTASSSRRTAWLTAGCVRPTRVAAFEKLRSAATAAKTRRSSRFMAHHNLCLSNDKNYKFDCLTPALVSLPDADSLFRQGPDLRHDAA